LGRSLYLKARRIFSVITALNYKKTTVYHTRHCSYKLHVRLVFVTKYRRKVFTVQIINELKTISDTVCLQFNAELIEFD
ncbi:transposase, partial [Succinatimonas hippei]|uniref:transposase n=1 Tax=Succinatimonas hippei TaxID=626938 RepID=UPI00201235C1